MRTLALLFLLFGIVARAASPGDKIGVLSGTTPVIDWNTEPVKTWTLSGNSAPTQANVPSSTTQRFTLEIQIVKPVGTTYQITTPAGIYWRTEDWSSLPVGSTNRILLEKLGGVVSATWIEAPEPGDPIWENDTGSIRISSGQFPTELFFESTAADNSTNNAVRVDTSSPWTVGNLFSVSNNGTLMGNIAAVSGYTGSGTQFLSDDGTYKSGNGPVLWAYNSGVLSPDPAIDVLFVESQLADSPTNVLFLGTTANSWTEGSMIQLINGSNTVFNVASVSGYTGGGTLFLSDDGTYKTAESIWTNVVGVIQPADGQTTNTLQYISGASDNSTNVLFNIDTANAWTDYAADFIRISNQNTNRMRFNKDGIQIGHTASVFDLNGLFINRQTDLGERPDSGVIINVQDASSYTNYALASLDAFIPPFNPTAQAVFGVEAGGDGGNTLTYFDVIARPERLIIDAENQDRILFYFQPSITNGIAYTFNTALSLTNGDFILEAQNQDSRRFAVSANSGYNGLGDLFLSSDGTYRLPSSDGTNTIVQQLGPGTVNFLPKWNTTNTLNDSITRQVGSTNITVAGTVAVGTVTNLLQASGGNLTYFNTSSQPEFHVSNGTDTAVFAVNSGVAVVSGNGGLVQLVTSSGSYSFSSTEFIASAAGSKTLGSASFPFGNLFINGSITLNGTTNTVGIFVGSGSPEGVLVKDKGSLYLDMANGENYIKTTNGVNTGWKLVTHAAIPFVAIYVRRKQKTSRRGFAAKGSRRGLRPVA